MNHAPAAMAGVAPAASDARARRELAGIAVALLLFALGLAALVPLLDPDEGRNAEVAREMAVSGDWQVPHLAGMPYLDKPPALFWAAALAIRVLGPTPLAARVPAMLAALATLLVLGALALQQGGRDLALRAVALLAVAPLFIALSAYVIFDMPLALCVTIVWTALARELAHGRPALLRTRMWLFLALTLGILIKGPVMLAWALGGSLAAALLLRSRDPLRWLACWPGWTMLLALAGGWFALATARHPEYPHYAFLEESLERLTSDSFKRDQPVWFVPAVLIGGTLPWSLLTPWRRALRGPTGDATRTGRVALGFVLFAVVFFTVSRSKLVTYLLPALPALAWLAAQAWSDAARAGNRRARVAFAACLVLPVALLLAGAPRLSAYARDNSGAPLAAAIRSAAPAAAIRYERCYSPGTDYVLGRRSQVVSESGRELRSSYQVRYRDTLIARGQWTPLASIDASPTPEVIVRRARDPEPVPAGYTEFHRDRRFVAFRLAPR